MKATIISAAMVGLIAGAAYGQTETSAIAPGTGVSSIGGNQNWGGADDDLWDNGIVTDGLNGLSNATDVPFGFRRTLLLDFVIPGGQTWTISGMTWRHEWYSLPPGSGTGFEIRFYDDAGNAPGTPITSVTSSTSYSEVATGGVYFSRQEAESVAGFAGQVLTAGNYWTDATIVGPENSFWNTAPIINNPVWIDYADYGGLQPGINVFGVDYDITGIIQGTMGGGGGYNLTVNMPNGCPGPITVGWSGAGSSGQQALVLGNNTGSTTIPQQYPCAGTVLGIQGGVMEVDPPGFFGVNGGSGSINGNINSGAICGKYLQLVKGGSCNTSNVAQIN